MSRPKEFEYDAALTKALNLFWELGYEATCMQGLVEATGLSRSSLYETFGDKRSLYLTALKRYVSSGYGRMIEALRQPGSKREIIETLFLEIIRLGEQCGNRGCMAVKGIADFREEEEDVRQILYRELEQFHTALIEAIREGQKQGEISEEIDPVATASYLISAQMGLNLYGKLFQDSPNLHQITKMTLSLLD